MPKIFQEYRRKTPMSLTVVKQAEHRMSELERYKKVLEHLADPNNWLTFYKSDARREEWARNILTTQVEISQPKKRHGSMPLI